MLQYPQGVEHGYDRERRGGEHVGGIRALDRESAERVEDAVRDHARPQAAALIKEHREYEAHRAGIYELQKRRQERRAA